MTIDMVHDVDVGECFEAGEWNRECFEAGEMAIDAELDAGVGDEDDDVYAGGASAAAVLLTAATEYDGR